ERLAAVEERVEAELALGADAALVPELEALVREHPLRERLRGQLMRALYRSGRQADGLAVYQEGRGGLVRALGVDPGPGLQRTQRARLRQEPGLAVDRSPARPGGTRGRRRYGVVVALAAALLLAAAIGAGAVELTRGPAGIVSVAPNSLAAIDARTNRI